MSSTTVRVSADTHAVLNQLARERHETIQKVLERAVEMYRRKMFWEETNAAFARLHEDEEAWREELDERKAWDATLADGVDTGG